MQWSKPTAYVVVENGATVGATVGVNLYWPDGSVVQVADLQPGETADRTLTTDFVREGRHNLYYTPARVYAKVRTIIQAGDNISLAWDDGTQTVTISAQAGYTGVPYFIPAGDTFTVPDNIQALYHLPIDLEDETAQIVVDGALVEV